MPGRGFCCNEMMPPFFSRLLIRLRLSGWGLRPGGRCGFGFALAGAWLAFDADRLFWYCAIQVMLCRGKLQRG